MSYYEVKPLPNFRVGYYNQPNSVPQDTTVHNWNFNRIWANSIYVDSCTARDRSKPTKFSCRVIGL